MSRRLTPTSNSTVRNSLAAAGLLFAVALVGCGSAAEQPAEDTPADAVAGASGGAATGPSGEFLYVASQNGPAVTVIDMGSREIVETIWLTDLGFTANAKPHHVAVEADGSHWYVSLIADGRVLKFDRDNQLVGEAEFETPGMLAVDPREDVLYVGRSMAAVNPPQRVGVVRRTDMAIDEVDVFFPRPHAIVAAPGGGRLFTASLAVNQIASLSPEEDDLEVINVPGDTHTFVQFAVSPDGATLVTGGQVSGEVMVFDLSDPTNPELTRTLDIGGEPWHPSYAPDGRFVYFPQRTTNSVAVIDTQTWEVVDVFSGAGLAEPHGSAISADGRYLWVSGRNTNADYAGEGIPKTSDLTVEGGEPMPAGTVVAIDTTTGEIVTVLEVPAYAAGLGVRAPR